LDIETSQAGRGAGNFGIIYSWAIKVRGGEILSDVVRDSILQEEKRILEHLAQVLPGFSKLYTWYGTGHDIPILRSRFAKHGLKFPYYLEVLHKDLYYAGRSLYKLHSNRLEAHARFFNIEAKKTPLDPDVWVQAAYGNTDREREEALQHILTHNREDTQTLEGVHPFLEPYIKDTDRSI
jgi:uncharacterized protein YprB with RNaseH-like and TPR domain